MRTAKAKASSRTLRKVDVVILASGLMGRQKKFPKALLFVGGKSILEHQIEYFEPYANKIIVACSEIEASFIKSYLRAAPKNVIFSIETQPLGTAGAVKKAAGLVATDDFLVVNVDDMTDIDLRSLINFGTNTVCVANPRLRYGMIEIEQGEVRSFREKPLLKDVWVNCGTYFINKELASKLPNRGSLEQDVFPYIDLRAYKHYGSWRTASLGHHDHSQ